MTHFLPCKVSGKSLPLVLLSLSLVGCGSSSSTSHSSSKPRESAFVGVIYTFPNLGFCFADRADVNLGIRAGQGKDREALEAMVSDGRIWQLTPGTPVKVAQVLEEIAAVYPQRGRYLEKRCYIPLATLQSMAN
jgi:hypothetical protein